MNRNWIGAMTLAAVVVLTSATDASAQRRGTSARGGWGANVGRTGAYGNSSYYGFPYSNYGYSNYGYSNYGSNWNRFGNAYSPFYSYSTPYYYSYSTPYYYSTPGATYVTPAPTTSFYNSVTPASHSESVSNSVATLSVMVPDDNAEIWLGTSATTSRGLLRQFQSPALEAGKDYVYTIRARWTADGKAYDQTRDVKVRAGQTSEVDFRSPQPERIPAPNK